MIGSSEELFRSLKEAGILEGEDTVAFTLEARVGHAARLIVERLVDARVGDAIAATLIQFDAREVPAD